MNERCCICLKLQDNVPLSTCSDSSDVTVIDKLKSCVPEIEWKDEDNICKECNSLLENAYYFRESCIKSKSMKYELWTAVKDEVEESPDHIETIECKDIVADETCVTCFHCEDKFTNKKLLACHIKLNHAVLKEYNCEKCGKKYTNASFWEKHVNVCKASYKYSEDEDTKEENVHKCDVCGTTFNNKYTMNRHKRNVHATEKRFKCDQCSSTFVSSVYLNAHKKYHSRDRKHICLFCGKGFITASELYHHEKIHANKRAYKCKECEKAFNTSSDLHKHKICVHLDRNLWKYSCSFCDRKFPLKTNLVTHIKTHTGEKNFSCILCEKKCISRSSLKRHVDTHKTQKSFVCNYCDLCFKFQKELDGHMMMKHGVSGEKSDNKVLCHLCPKSFQSNASLKKHLSRHLDHKILKSSICKNKEFSDECHLKLNMGSDQSENKLTDS